MDSDQRHQQTNSHEADENTDAILAELEAEEDQDISSLRTQRLNELSKNLTSSTNAAASIKREIYPTLDSDDHTLRFTTEHENAIVHFFHPDFGRCSIMDEHLTQIAQLHADFGTGVTDDGVQFARVDVRYAEFIVQKLGIRVLPCVIGFTKGQIKGRIIGFEGVSWEGKEKGATVTRAIEDQMVHWTVLKKSLVRQHTEDQSESEEEQVSRTRRRGIAGRKQQVTDEDDDWD